MPGKTGTPADAASLRAAVLSPSSSSSSGVGPTKVMPAFLAGAREGGILGEEAVAGVDRVDVVLFRERDDPGDVEIGFDGTFAGADLVGFVGLEAMQAEAIFLGIDGDGAQSEFGGGAKDADGDLAAVGGEQFLDRFGFLHSGSDLSATRNPRLFHERGEDAAAVYSIQRKNEIHARRGGVTRTVAGR